MDNGYWIKQAHKYICEHHAFSEVSDIVFTENESIISASVSINLPSKFIETGVTNKGIRSKEYIKFIFYDNFPLDAPKIVLRNDFPRNFPHINPSKDEVLPCIYAGDLSELLQQPQWMNGILDQLVNWLENAASNSLLNQKQGWEPMRNDDFRGFIVYNDYEILKILSNNADNSVKYRIVQYFENQKFVFAGNQILFNKIKDGRVEPGGHPPGTPTDLDVPNFRTAGTRHPVPLVKVSLSNMSVLSSVSEEEIPRDTLSRISSLCSLSGSYY
jgi:hypothetical protein